MKENKLPDLRIASPCHANWAEMTGDARARFCGSCQKHVYNISAMTARQAADLIRQKEGKLCVRYYLRRDGTILTQDCPVGLAAVRKQLLKIAAAFVSVLALVGFGGCKKEEEQTHTGEPGRVMGIVAAPQTEEPRELMGDVVATPPQTNQVYEIKGEICPPSTNGVSVIQGSPAPEDVSGVEMGRPIMGKVAAPRTN